MAERFKININAAEIKRFGRWATRKARAPITYGLVGSAIAYAGGIDYASGKIQNISAPAVHRVHGEEPIRGTVVDKAPGNTQVFTSAPLKWEDGIGLPDNITMTVSGDYFFALTKCKGNDDLSTCPIDVVAVDKKTYDETSKGDNVSLPSDLRHKRLIIIRR